MQRNFFTWPSHKGGRPKKNCEIFRFESKRWSLNIYFYVLQMFFSQIFLSASSNTIYIQIYIFLFIFSDHINLLKKVFYEYHVTSHFEYIILLRDKNKENDLHNWIIKLTTQFFYVRIKRDCQINEKIINEKIAPRSGWSWLYMQTRVT